MVEANKQLQAGAQAALNQGKSFRFPRYNLVQFSGTNLLYSNHKNMKQVPDLTKSSYVPDGNTDLYDAIGCTVEHFSKEHHNKMIIITDGDDNISKIYRKQEIVDLLNKVQNENNWKVHYLRVAKKLYFKFEKFSI